MTNTKLLTMVLAAAGALALPSKSADASTCTLPASKAVHRYWQQVFFQNGQPSNTERCTYSNGWKCHLSGWLYTPTGTTGQNLPMLMYVHGSGGNWSDGGSKGQSGNCEMVNYYLSRGYVVWAPYMRGVADSTGSATPDGTYATSTSAGFINTGTYVGDWAETESQPGSTFYPWFTAAMPGWGVSSPDEGDYKALATLEYMDEEVDDIQSALSYATNLPGLGGTGKLIDPNKIAMSGHSYGGATIILASSHALTPLPKATVDMSGGVLSWAGSDIWGNVLTYYAARHKQALMARLNDSESSTGDFEPGQAIYDAALTGGTGTPRLKKYSTGSNLAALCATDNTNQCFHTQFQVEAGQVARWAPDVLDFLRDNGVQ